MELLKSFTVRHPPIGGGGGGEFGWNRGRKRVDPQILSSQKLTLC